MLCIAAGGGGRLGARLGLWCVAASAGCGAARCARTLLQYARTTSYHFFNHYLFALLLVSSILLVVSISSYYVKEAVVQEYSMLKNVGRP